MTTALLQVSLSLALCLTSAQAQPWQRFSTPDGSLTVELPARPKVFNKKDESPEVIFENVKSVYFYSVSLKLESDPEIFFSVLRLSKRMSNRDFDEVVNSNMLWIGGDDKHFSKEADVIVSNLHGREFIFEKGIMSGRVLFINGGTRIYYLMFQTELEHAKTSEAVARIFNSFRPRR